MTKSYQEPNIHIMFGLPDSIKEFAGKYRSEIILITISLIIVSVSIVIYVKSSNFEDNDKIEISNTVEKTTPKLATIFIDLSGAVEKPAVYEVTTGARLNDLIKKAGGISAEADKDYFYRNFNLARFLTDQEKIYIPYLSETYTGVFIETQKILDYTKPQPQTVADETNSSLININEAEIEELDTLPGIGQVTADKIIQNRPYTTIDDLLQKKVVKKNVFEQIKTMISVE